MKRLPRLVTEPELHQPGRDLRVRDVIAISGLSRGTILNEVERGRLHGYRLYDTKGCPWKFRRDEVLRWLHIGLRKQAC